MTVETSLPLLGVWSGEERRKGVPEAPLFGELLVESSWRPADRLPAASEGWMRAFGYAPDRRDADEPLDDLRRR